MGLLVLDKPLTFIHLGPAMHRDCCCCCSFTKLCPTLCEPIDCSIPGFPLLHYLLEFEHTFFGVCLEFAPSPCCSNSMSALYSMSGYTHIHYIISVVLLLPSNNLTLSRPLLFLPSIFPSTRVFSTESALYVRWPKYWSFSFTISPFNENSGLISFRIHYSLVTKSCPTLVAPWGVVC